MPIASARARATPCPTCADRSSSSSRTTRPAAAITAATAQVAGDARRSIVMGRLRHRRHPDGRRSGSGRRRDARAAGCRIRAAALSQPRDGAPQRHALRQPMELPRDRHGARVGHPARRVGRHHRRRARQRHGVPIGHVALQLALLVPADAGRAALSRARRWSMCRLRPRRSWAPADRRGSSSPRDFIWNDDLPGRSRRARHARRRARSDNSPTTATAPPAWPTTCG